LRPQYPRHSCVPTVACLGALAEEPDCRPSLRFLTWVTAGAGATSEGRIQEEDWGRNGRVDFGFLDVLILRCKCHKRDTVQEAHYTGRF